MAAHLHDSLRPEKIAELLGIESLTPHALDKLGHKDLVHTGELVVERRQGPHDVGDVLQGQLLHINRCSLGDLNIQFLS